MRISLFILFVTFSNLLFANERSPSWMLEFDAGLYSPELEGWESHYGSSRFPNLSLSAAYRLFSVVDAGASITYGKDKGSAELLSSGAQTGTVEHLVLPVDIYLLLRGKLTNRQWIVPYVGGGYTRYFYRQEIVDQDVSTGSVGGKHMRIGLQFLLDVLDANAAGAMRARWGVINSYLYVDYKQTTADLNGIALGGESYKMGMMFEFK